MLNYIRIEVFRSSFCSINHHSFSIAIQRVINIYLKYCLSANPSVSIWSTEYLEKLCLKFCWNVQNVSLVGSKSVKHRKMYSCCNFCEVTLSCFLFYSFLIYLFKAIIVIMKFNNFRILLRINIQVNKSVFLGIHHLSSL